MMMRPGAIYRGLTDTVRDPFSAETTGLPDATNSELVELTDGGSFDLRAGPVRKRLGDAVVRMLAYNGSIPGPTLKVAQGAEVTINFTNQADVETTVHWHGLRLDNRYDGVPHGRHQGMQAAIPVGGGFAYRLRFPDPGIYWYHPHVREDYTQELGLYGNIIVTPSDPEYWPPVNRELVLVLDDILLKGDKVAPFSRTGSNRTAMGRYGNVMLVNGQTEHAMEARRGEVVRLYLTNTANVRPFNVRILGARMRLVGGDGGRIEHEQFVTDVLIAPSERAVVDVLFEQAGQFRLEHSSPDSAYTLGTITVHEWPVERSYAQEFSTLRTSPELEAERALFRRVAAFAGGWTLDAAEAVAGLAVPEIGAAGVGVPDVLGSLTSLADKNLVLIQPAGNSPRDAPAEPRFRMLETAREFALDLLEASAEADPVRRRHAEFFATLAERAEPQLQGAGQAAMVARLEREEDNFRQALRWSLARGDAQAQEQGLRLAGALGWYWFLHGAPSEAREWFQVLLRPTASADQPSAVRARALNAAGFRATNHAEYGIASEFHDQALESWRELRDTPGMVASLHGLGDTALWVGEADKARAHYEGGLELARTTGTAEDLALFAFHLGQLWWLEGDLDLGEQYGQEALAVARAAGSTTWTAYALYVLASLAHERGDLRRAGRLYREALGLGWEHHDRLCVRMALPGLAGVAAMEGDAARALRLASAASGLEDNAGMWAFPPIRARQEQWLATAQQALDAGSREAAWAEGRRMSMDEVIAHALEDMPTVADARSEIGPAVRERLSSREREVLGLVAQGRSNREIADALVVTEHTAKYHVAQLLNKLGAGSRAEAVTRAVAAGLLAPTSD